MTDRVESRLPSAPPPPTDEQLERLAGALAPGGALSHVRRLAGGVSCAMDVLEVAGAMGAPQRFVLRRHPSGSFGFIVSAEREALALELAGAVGVPVPSVVWIDDAGIFDETALVLSFLEGEPPAGSINTQHRADQLAGALVRIHSVVLAKREHTTLERYVAGEGDDGVSVPDALAAHSLGPALLDRIRDLRRSLVEVDECFLHADYHPGNSLWRKEQLVGVVDWEMAGIGDPAFDVAYCATDLRCLGLDAPADRFIATYRRISGRQLPNLTYWTAIALARAMPDVASWLPAFATMDGDVTASALRRKHSDLVEGLLAD